MCVNKLELECEKAKLKSELIGKSVLSNAAILVNMRNRIRELNIRFPALPQSHIIIWLEGVKTVLYMPQGIRFIHSTYKAVSIFHYPS